MLRFGIGELSIILFILMLLFGAKKLPEVSRGIAQAIKEFKKAGKETTGDPE